jgi:hypothetical protein
LSYSPVAVEQFTGLNLVDDPGTVGWGGAIDLLNVDFDTTGRVRSRDGSAEFRSVAAADYYDHIAPTNIGGTSRIVGFRNTTVEVLSGSGVVVASQAVTVSPGAGDFVDFGTPTTSYGFFANGVDALKRFDGSAWASPAFTGTSPTGHSVAVTPWDNRLVNGGFTANPSRVIFSDAGDPLTFGANNYIDLHPGDGGTIYKIIAWRDLLFVFKDTGRFFVFYGTSTDSTGNPIFNYRTVETGLPYGTYRAAVAAPDGVYFVSRTGVYKTTGGPPVEVSGALRPLFLSETLTAGFSTLGGSVVNLFDLSARMAVSSTKLFVSTRFSPNTPCLFVYDFAADAWSIWNIPTAGGWAVTVDSGEGALFWANSTGSGSTKQINKFPVVTPATTDNGSNITSRYRSGFTDLGSSDKKVIREWRLTGSGSPTFKTSYDFGSLETGSAIALGTSPAIAENRRRFAVKGRQFSWQISGTSPWSVNNLVAHVQAKKLPGDT